MKIVIATGIYPPQIGGPALYAQGLAEALREKGHVVHVVTFGSLLSYPSGIRHVLYLFRLIPRLWRADACIALDTFSVALPSLVGCTLFRVPFVIRTGGDFLWESYSERTAESVPFSLFYQTHSSFTFQEQVIFLLTRFVTRHACMVFSTVYQRDVWVRVYHIKNQTRIIENAIPEKVSAVAPRQKNFLWYVRPLALKNPERVHRAFLQAQKKYPDLRLEEGQVPHDELIARMSSCYAVILPSVSEISPNYILDALRCVKPFILTKECGYAEKLGPYGRLVDPLDEYDIAQAFEELATTEGYAKACEKVVQFNEVRPYAAVADDFISLLESL